MKAATLLILVLSNAGYWFGGEPAEVTLQWAVEPPAQADLVWELQYSKTVLGAGKVALPRGEAQATLHIQTPPVRARTGVQLRWRIVTPVEPDPVESGQAPIVLFPVGVLKPLPALLHGEPLLLLDDDEGLARTLDAADAPFQRLDSLDDLTLHRRGVVLIGPHQIADTPGPFAPSPLIDAARRGLRIMAFQQNSPARLADLPIALRLAPAALRWRSDHPLFRGLTEDDLASWCANGQPLAAVRIAADAPALELAYWPLEPRAGVAGPIDAAALTRTVGDGRVVLWQLPLGDWETDPRSQTLLLNAIDYLLTPPRPTPPPQARQKQINVQIQAIPPGAQP